MNQKCSKLEKPILLYTIPEIYTQTFYIPGGGNINLSGHTCSVNAFMCGSGD